MKIPLTLTKGLSDEEAESLERELKNSIIAKQLRKILSHCIQMLEINEEQLKLETNDLYSLIGERRGLRSVLKLLPED